MFTAKLVMLETPWSATPQDRRWVARRIFSHGTTERRFPAGATGPPGAASNNTGHHCLEGRDGEAHAPARGVGNRTGGWFLPRRPYDRPGAPGDTGAPDFLTLSARARAGHSASQARARDRIRPPRRLPPGPGLGRPPPPRAG